MKIFLKFTAFIIGAILSIMTDYSLISQYARLHFIIMGGFLCYFMVELILWQFSLLTKTKQKYDSIKNKNKGKK